MSEQPKTVHNVLSPIGDVQSLEGFEELLKVYKLQNPGKYALKEVNGEYDRFRASLGGKPKKAPKEELKELEPPKKKKEEKVEEKKRNLNN